MLEPWVTILALAVILGYARLGASFGLFCELPNALMLLLAMLVSLRYWYPFSETVGTLLGQPSGITAVIAFWALLIISCCPMIALLRRITEDSRPTYPRRLNELLGFGLGVISAGIFFSCVMLSVSLFLPTLWGSYDRTTLYVHWDTMPVRMYRHIESRWLGIAANDPGHTRFPTFDNSETTEPSWR